jgi:hypothetical protein
VTRAPDEIVVAHFIGTNGVGNARAQWATHLS